MNNNFFQETIPDGAIQGMKHLGDSFSNFSSSIQQIINFQFMLYEGLQDLALKFTGLKQSLNKLEESSSVDVAIASYFDRNPVIPTTRSGLSIDDALDIFNDKLLGTYEKLDKFNKLTSTMQTTLDNTCTQDDLRNVISNQKQNNQTIMEALNAISKLQNQIEKQNVEISNHWDSMKNMFKSQSEETNILLSKKADKTDLEFLITNAQLCELLTLFANVSAAKKTKIPEIINQVFQDNKTTIEEKIKLCYEFLSVEKDRLQTERSQLVTEFRQLRSLAETKDGFDISPEFYTTEVRDVGTDSGVIDVFEPHMAKLKKL